MADKRRRGLALLSEKKKATAKARRQHLPDLNDYLKMCALLLLSWCSISLSQCILDDGTLMSMRGQRLSISSIRTRFLSSLGSKKTGWKPSSVSLNCSELLATASSSSPIPCTSSALLSILLLATGGWHLVLVMPSCIQLQLGVGFMYNVCASYLSSMDKSESSMVPNTDSRGYKQLSTATRLAATLLVERSPGIGRGHGCQTRRQRTGNLSSARRLRCKVGSYRNTSPPPHVRRLQSSPRTPGRYLHIHSAYQAASFKF